MVHDPQWPDKVTFAAYLLILGGLLGLAVEGLRLVGTVEDRLPPGALENYPHWLSAALAGAMVVLGVLCWKTQAAVFAYTGAAAGLFSLAYGGLVPFLSLLAIVMMIKSHIEGEETRNDGKTMHHSLWPDKAMGASLFILVGGTVILYQGILIGLDRYEPIVLKGMAPVAMAIDVLVGLFCFWASRQVFLLRRAWPGEVAAAGLAVTFGLYLLGPLLALIAFLHMRKARAEDEFAKHAGGATQRAATKKGKRSKGTA